MKAGDLVYLKSGGDQMVVLRKSQERGEAPTYTCAWIDREGTMHCHEIPEVALILKDQIQEAKS